MVRKINKKSRQFISRRRRGVINKRTLRRNKSRVGGEITNTCSLKACPEFTFVYNNVSYKIKKTITFKWGEKNKYSLFRTNNGPEMKIDIENLECKDFITKITTNNWFTTALRELINDYNIITSNGENPTEFKHFNELLITMIKNFIDNYDSQYLNEYTIALSIKQIIEKNLSIIGGEINEGWCVLGVGVSVNVQRAYFCGKKTKDETEIDKSNFDKMCTKAATAAAAAPAVAICILENYDSDKHIIEICPDVNTLIKESTMVDNITISVWITKNLNKFAEICADVLTALSISGNNDMFNRIIELIINYSIKTYDITQPEAYLRTDNFYSKTIKLYVDKNSSLLNNILKIIKDEALSSNIKSNELTQMEEIFKRKFGNFGCDINCIIKIRKELNDDEKKFVAKIINYINNIFKKFHNKNVIPTILSKFTQTYNIAIDNDNRIKDIDKAKYKEKVQQDIYLRIISPIISFKLSTFISKVVTNKINNITTPKKPDWAVIIDINLITEKLPTI